MVLHVARSGYNVVSLPPGVEKNNEKTSHGGLAVNLETPISTAFEKGAAKAYLVNFFRTNLVSAPDMFPLGGRKVDTLNI